MTIYELLFSLTWTAQVFYYQEVHPIRMSLCLGLISSVLLDLSRVQWQPATPRESQIPSHVSLYHENLVLCGTACTLRNFAAIVCLNIDIGVVQNHAD